MDETFLLLYGDNFVPYDHRKHFDFFRQQKKNLCLIVQNKAKGNIRLNADRATVEVYDKTRSAEKLDFVELGYMMARKEIFGYYDKADVSFSDIIARLVQSRQVAGRIVQDAYYSISDMDRLRLMERYLKPKKILLIDRDGVINQKVLRGEYVKNWNDFVFIDENVDGMIELSREGFSFVVITNQAGIARGMVRADDVDSIHRQMTKALQDKGVRLLGIYMCPHHWEDGCFCRKPEPGLFFAASRDHCFRLDKTYYIGDDTRDCQAAYRAGCQCIYTADKEELRNLATEEQPSLVVASLKEAVPKLLNYDYFKNAV